MRPLAFVLTLLSLPGLAGAQEVGAPDGAVVESAAVTGVDPTELGDALQHDIEALAGTPLDRSRLTLLVTSIETELPDAVVAVRDTLQPDGRVRVLFLVVRISDDEALEENINARYIVERVDVDGVSRTWISPDLRDALDALVGERLDPTEAAELDRRLEAALPEYRVRHEVDRGTERGRVRVVFRFSEVPGRRWVPFARPFSKLVYHEDQGWSGVLAVGWGGRRHGFNLTLVRGNNDDLVEEYSGIGLRFQTRDIGTRRLGLSLELSRYTQGWDPATEAALAIDPGVPGAYRVRRTVEPLVTFAFDPRVRLVAGVRVTSLDPTVEGAPPTAANAFVTRLVYEDSLVLDSGVEQRLEASYEWHAGVSALASDLVYRRHAGRARYVFHHRRGTFVAAAEFGQSTGHAPLFERFTLGDSRTLRGWNAYDLAPAGASRMFHQSLEYEYRGLAYFLDAGSVWDAGEDVHVRLSTGLGFRFGPMVGIGLRPFSLLVGFPLNAEKAGATVLLGIGF